jgi:hypothetical protein
MTPTATPAPTGPARGARGTGTPQRADDDSGKRTRAVVQQ